jgi:hypothetical protein
MGGVGCIVSGLIAGPVTRLTGNMNFTRKLMACIGFAGACASLILASTLHEPFLAVSAVALSSFCNDLVMPMAWGTVMDVSGGYSGTLAGTMNMMGNLGGALYGPVAGAVLQRTNHDWNAVLLMGAAAYITGVIMWLGIDPETPIDEPRAAKVNPMIPMAVVGMLLAVWIYFLSATSLVISSLVGALAAGLIGGVILGSFVRKISAD